MQQIDDITLIKILGKGSFGEVYLSTKKGRTEYFATKKVTKEYSGFVCSDSEDFKPYLVG